MTAPAKQKVAGPYDAPQASADATAIGPGGQLAIPGTPGAQLGLDGRDYAPLSRDAANSSLGPSHEVLHGTGAGPERGAPSPHGAQLALDLDAWEASPQLSVWARLKVAHDLLRYGEFDRDAKCCRTRFAHDAPAVARRGASGAWSLSGVIKCGQWTCPCCGVHRARETAAKLGVAMQRHLAKRDAYNPDAWPDVWMLTLALPHAATTTTEHVVDQLYDASARFWRSRAWRRFEKRWGIVARVRVLDATHGGKNGSHPHFHIALFPTAASVDTFGAIGHKLQKKWNVRDGALVLAQLDGAMPLVPLRSVEPAVRDRFLAELRVGLLPAWEECVRAAGATIANVGDFRLHSLKISGSEQAAAYFTKWGLADEVGAPTAKTRNHLRLLDAVAGDVRGAAVTFKRWRRAVVGHAWVSGLADLCTLYNVTDDDAHAYVLARKEQRDEDLRRRGEPVPESVPELQLVVRSHLYEAALALGWERVFAECDAWSKAGADVQRELDAFLWSHAGMRVHRELGRYGPSG